MTRIALVGAGRMGRVHLRLLHELEGVEVTAVVDPVADCATHRGIEQLGSVDGAIVAAPSTEHLAIVAHLLAAGIPTLCEKPCGTSTAEAAEALRLAAELGTPLQIGYWRRFVPALRALRERIAAGELGEIVLVRSVQWDERPPPGSFRVASGGILVDMGVHELDQIRWLTGQELACRGVAASRVCVDPPIDGDSESIEALYELGGGGLAAVSLARRHPPGDLCRVEVVGTESAADCMFVAPADPQRGFDEGIAAQDRAFIELVRGGPQQGARPEDAVGALAAAEEAQSLWGAKIPSPLNCRQIPARMRRRAPQSP